MMLSKGISVIALAVTILVAAVGCASVESHSSGSRHELFASVRDLSAASSMVVVVDVIDQKVEGESIPNTVSIVVPIESFTPDGLGSALDVEPSKAGDQIVVRQVVVELDKGAYPVLSVGGRYLLFLTPTMLEGEQASQYYVTGGSAGVYSVDGETYIHGPFEEGDQLPEKLTATDLR